MKTSRRDFIRMGCGSALAAMVSPYLINSALAADSPHPDEHKGPFSSPLDVSKLADGIFLIANGGGNILVHVANDDVFVIDSGVPDRASDILSKINELASQAKRKLLFNTHWHFDHTGGNTAFADAGFNIISSEKTYERMGQTIVFEDMGMTSQPSAIRARPKVTFGQISTLHTPLKIQLIKIAPAHTDTDAVAIIEEYGIIHTGDLLFAGMFPVIDRSSGGSLDGMVAASKQLLGQIDPRTKVIPGHGPVTDASGLKAQLDLLQLTRDRLAPFGDKKSTMEEVLTKQPLADLDSQWGNGFIKSPLYTRMAYGQWLTK